MKGLIRDGVSRTVRLDAKTGSLKTVDFPHSQIHDGDAFHCSIATAADAFDIASPMILEFTTPDILVGREQTCDLVLDEKTVSGEHARLSYHHGNWWVEDLHSRNGTFLNLELLDTQVVLTSGDELQVGQEKIRIEIGGNIDDSAGVSAK